MGCRVQREKVLTKFRPRERYKSKGRRLKGQKPQRVLGSSYNFCKGERLTRNLSAKSLN
jgi:hypothetical protein